jgi:hypothetical protein
VFAKDKITVQETVEEGSGNEIYQVMTGREIVYSGWAMLLSQRFAFDWSKINLPLLLNAIKWGAPIGSAKQAPLVRSLVDAIKAEAEEEKANEYLDILCQLLAAVRRVEADYICNGLYQADILNRVVQRAQIKPHSQALISILRTDFSSEVLGSLYKDIQGNAKGLVVILGLVNESPEVFSSILSEIHRQKKWDVIKAVVIDTLNVNVLYGLQMLEYKVLYKKQSYPGLADFDLSLQAMERLMEALYARAGSGANLLFDQVMPDQSRDSNSFVLSQFRGRAASIVATNSSDDDWSSHDDVTDMQQLQSFIRDQQWVQFIALLGSSQEDLDLIQIKKWLETANYKQTCEQSQQIDDALAQAPRKQELRNSLKRAKKASQHGRRQVPALPCVDEVIAHKAYCKDITIEQIGRQLRAIGNFGSYLFAAIGEQIMLYVLLRDDAIGEYSITTRGLSTEITVDEEDGGKLAVNAIAGENTLAAFLENNKSILRLPVSQEKVIYEGGCSDDDELPEPPTAAKPDSSATMQALYKQPVKRGNGLIGKDSSSLLGGKSPALPPRQTAEPNPAEAPSSTA